VSSSGRRCRSRRAPTGSPAISLTTGRHT
jgi:hypothetical protein